MQNAKVGRNMVSKNVFQPGLGAGGLGLHFFLYSRRYDGSRLSSYQMLLACSGSTNALIAICAFEKETF